MIEPLAYFRERQEHTFHEETNTFIQNYDREMPLGNNSSFYQGKKKVANETTIILHWVLALAESLP